MIRRYKQQWPGCGACRVGKRPICQQAGDTEPKPTGVDYGADPIGGLCAGVTRCFRSMLYWYVMSTVMAYGCRTPHIFVRPTLRMLVFDHTLAETEPGVLALAGTDRPAAEAAGDGCKARRRGLD